MAKPVYDQYVRWGSHEEVLDGIKKATEQRKRAFRKNIPSYLWTTIKDLLALVVIVAIFNTELSLIEAVGFALAILIYIVLEALFGSHTYQTTVTVTALSDELLEIKVPPQREENETEKRRIKEALAVYQNLEINFVVHSMFLFVFGLIVLAKLLGSII